MSKQLSKEDDKNEFLVTGCNDCPFEYNCCDGWSNSECRHPKGNYKELTYLVDGVTFEFNDGESPEWCPLKKEQITIKLNKTPHDYTFK